MVTGVMFREPKDKEFPLVGGLDLISINSAMHPGSMIFCKNLEIVGGRTGYSIPGGYERCTNDTVPSGTRVYYFTIESMTANAAIDDEFTSGTQTIKALNELLSPQNGDILVVASHESSFTDGSVWTRTGNSFTLTSVASDTSGYTQEELRAYRLQAIEQTRDAIPVLATTSDTHGGFRLKGKNYVFWGDGLYEGGSYVWTKVTMPDVMYFDEGVVEPTVGDTITDGTATGVVASVTKQEGSFNYEEDAVDQATGYLTLTSVSGTFTSTNELTVSGAALAALTNGSFVTDSDWAKGTGWTIDVPNAWAECDASQLAESLLSQAYTTAEYDVINVEIVVSRYVAGNVSVRFGTDASETVASAATHNLQVVCSSARTSFSIVADTDFDGDIASVTLSRKNVAALTNGLFTTDTHWTKGDDWTIDDGDNNKATCASGTGERLLSQAYLTSKYDTIDIELVVSAYTAGNVSVRFGTDDSETVASADTHNLQVVCASAGTLFSIVADTDFDGVIDTVTLSLGNIAKVYSANTTHTLSGSGKYETKVYNFTNLVNNSSAFGVNGQAEAFEFDGTNYIPIFNPSAESIDTPFHIDIHQERLQLFYEGGQMIYSVSGQPRVYNALLGSGVWSTGDEITGSRVVHGNAQTIYTTRSAWMLTGTGDYDETTATRAWQFYESGEEIGAIQWSIASHGHPISMSSSGIYQLKSTDTTGGYISETVAEQIRPFLDNYKSKVVGAIWCRDKSQYRLFFSDGYAVYVSFYKGRSVGATKIIIPDGVTNVWAEVEGETEYIFFTSDTGYLYRMDSGNTFDTNTRSGSFRLPFHNYGSTRREKMFPQMILAIDPPVILTSDTSITYTVTYDNGSLNSLRPVAETIDDVEGAGGLYGDNLGYDNFVWSGSLVSNIHAYIDGYGANMSILVTYESKYDSPVTFLSATVDYIELGRQGQK